MWGEAGWWRPKLMWGEAGWWRPKLMWGEAGWWRPKLMWGEAGWWRPKLMWGEAGWWRPKLIFISVRGSFAANWNLSYKRENLSEVDKICQHCSHREYSSHSNTHIHTLYMYIKTICIKHILYNSILQVFIFYYFLVHLYYPLHMHIYYTIYIHISFRMQSLSLYPIKN